MWSSQFTEDQIIGLLKQAEADLAVTQIRRKGMVIDAGFEAQKPDLPTRPWGRQRWACAAPARGKRLSAPPPHPLSPGCTRCTAPHR